ncbi:hypothetical protein [Paenibacillus tritici]|nr:hypothetical protein [Paenibacillus tritici]
MDGVVRDEEEEEGKIGTEAGNSRQIAGYTQSEAQNQGADP